MVTTWLAVAISFFGVVLVPLVLYLVKGANRLGKAEQQLADVLGNVQSLVIDKDKVHHEILETMRADREATDKRLRFMEEYWMRKGLE